MSYRDQFLRDQKIAMIKSLKSEDKSYSNEPALEDGFGNWASEVEANIDRISLKNIYFQETWVYIIINLVARKIASQPLSICRDVLKNETIVSEQAESHKLMTDLWNPNEYEGYTSFFYKLACELSLMGNAIIWRMKFHKQMLLLPTEITSIEFDRTGKIKWYIVDFGTVQEYSSIYNGNIKIHPSDIIHVKLPHLNSVFWGFSPLIAGRKSMLFDKYTKEFLLNFYLKQANPGPILEMGELANEKQAIRLLKSVELNWTGRRNQRRTMILPKGVTAKTLMQTMAEQQLKEHLLINRDDLRAIYAIPPHELGLQQAGSIGSNETKEQMKNFYQQTIIPYQNLIADELTRYFEKELGSRFYIKFDNSDVAALQEDEKTKAELATIQMNFMSINEIRAKLYDLPPIAGGDIIRGSQQQQPNFPNYFSGNPQEEIPRNEEEINEDEELERTESPKTKYAEWWGKRKSNEDNTVIKSERIVLKNLLDIFEEQAVIAVKEFKDIFATRLKQDGFYPEEERLKNALQKAFNEYEEVYVKETVPTLQASSDIGYNIHLDVPFNLPSKQEIYAIGSRNEENRRSLMEARAIRNFQGFTQTTTNDILKTIERGMNESKTLDEIAKDIITYFGEYAPGRAKTIARTETLLAVSMGQKAAEEDASSLIPGMKKQWISAGDERVRDSHENLDGQTIEVGKSWKTMNGANLEFPRDPRGPANEIINCRCSWLMIPPEID